MRLAEIFLGQGEAAFGELVRSISLGKLKTFQLFERLKTRLHLNKLNTETLRKSAVRCWQRLPQPDSDELAAELSQAILISHMDLIKAVLDELGMPHEEGFFAKDIEAKKYLTPGWQSRVHQRFQATHAESLLLFYINHLDWEVAGAEDLYRPEAPGVATVSS